MTLTLLGVLGTWITAGVTLTMTNKTSAEVRRVWLAYGTGTMTVASLKPGEHTSRFVGKLGEGASFKLGVQRGGRCFEAPFDVYFYSLFPWPTVHVELISDELIRVREGDSPSPYANLTVPQRLAPCSHAQPR